MIIHPIGRGDRRLVTAHTGGATVTGRIQWAHGDGTFNIDRTGFVARRFGTCVRTAPGAELHPVTVAVLPCCPTDGSLNAPAR